MPAAGMHKECPPQAPLAKCKIINYIDVLGKTGISTLSRTPSGEGWLTLLQVHTCTAAAVRWIRVGTQKKDQGAVT